MSSRRRAARRARGREDVHAPPAPFDPAEALARWRQKLVTMSARGFDVPPCAGLVFGPVVRVDLGGDDPACDLRERTEREIVRVTSGQTRS